MTSKKGNGLVYNVNKKGLFEAGYVQIFRESYKKPSRKGPIPIPSIHRGKGGN